ncbi:MAG TPA: NADH-quinone oxidoreductase subunit C [Candidatus Saccharicenans sp.]|jgi:Ni,Fe-hydrogenase III large subunit/Ni,Fe-hydrogenase III component G|nr:NADH-quinone oxidoreductase subunit C [Candidatus Saccharicenans sp.]HOL45242.1 NADH-quinone oxidoreductase subunit C [Candidatus Saccharicenans sp.]HOM93770.1 NADH-quinone oxidoreductase subunit C [Candidatus Saccharicenans sp.]HPC87816.1 NADH-quinone oxidoreductase subunit C [Candidatus Saccharicenans sp.]HPP23630.1 NADH-quinone oxidoreductase subunit C [Candidatus Saccharicenans sp.]
MSRKDELLNLLKDELKGNFLAASSLEENRLFIDIKKEALVETANQLMRAGARYQMGVGYEARKNGRGLAMVHTFAFDADSLLVAIRALTTEDEPEFDSLTPFIPGAGWSEREYIDLLGLHFKNHPHPKRLVLSDDWPEGIYPLRQEVPYDLMPPAAEEVAFRLDEAPPGSSIIPFGPFHACLHEPAHFAVYVDGEEIKGCEYRGFMVHRGIEKLAATELTYNEIPFVAERICGICGSVHSVNYAQAVEAASGLKIPRRAEFIRTIMLEIERLHSHLMWLGVAGHLIGFDTVFMQAWRIREKIMWLAESLTGNRKTYGMVIVGGVRRDIDLTKAELIKKTLAEVEKDVQALEKAIIKDKSIHRRTKGVGYLSREKAKEWNLVGPVARARGLDIDARRDHPYAAYDEVKFEVVVADSGDVWGTLVVRIKEIYEAIRIIHQCLEKLASRLQGSPLAIEIEDPIPAGQQGLSVVEAPRGEAVHYVLTGDDNRPERWRVRAPTYPNLQAVPDMLLNNKLADFPIIVGSIDPCISCTDRVAVIDRRSASGRILSRQELEKLSREMRSKT